MVTAALVKSQYDPIRILPFHTMPSMIVLWVLGCTTAWSVRFNLSLVKLALREFAILRWLACQILQVKQLGSLSYQGLPLCPLDRILVRTSNWFGFRLPKNQPGFHFWDHGSNPGKFLPPKIGTNTYETNADYHQ